MAGWVAPEHTGRVELFRLRFRCNRSKGACEPQHSDFAIGDSETVRPWMSWIHIVVGFSVPVVFALHILLGRR
jgi:hypothetical protein